MIKLTIGFLNGLVINMEIKCIKVNNVDNNVRAITIKTSERDIKTPNRSIGDLEFNKLKGMRNNSDEPASPFDVVEEAFPWQIYQPKIEYKEQVRRNIFLNENGLRNKSSQVKTKVNAPSRMLDEDESKNLLKILFPRITKKDVIDSKFMTALMEIEMNAGLDVLTIPEPSLGCTYEDFKSNIENVISFLDEYGNEKPVMPLIDTGSNGERFEKKFNYIKDQFLNSKKDFSMLGVSCRVYREHINLHTLRDSSDVLEKFWVHGFGAYRNQPNSTFYNPHAAAIWGIDTVGVTPQGGYYPGINDMNNSMNKDEKLRMYTEDSWGVHKGSKQFISQHLCDCDGCKYYRKTTEDLQVSLDVHELIKSHEQIVNSRQNIEENQYLKLVKEKDDFTNYYNDNVKDI